MRAARWPLSLSGWRQFGYSWGDNSSCLIVLCAQGRTGLPACPSSTALFEAEWTYAYPYAPAHSPSRPFTGLLPTHWKQRDQTARDPQQSYGVAARKAHSPLGLVGSRREGRGHAAWNQSVYHRR